MSWPARDTKLKVGFLFALLLLRGQRFPFPPSPILNAFSLHFPCQFPSFRSHVLLVVYLCLIWESERGGCFVWQFVSEVPNILYLFGESKLSFKRFRWQIERWLIVIPFLHFQATASSAYFQERLSHLNSSDASSPFNPISGGESIHFSASHYHLTNVSKIKKMGNYSNFIHPLNHMRTSNSHPHLSSLGILPMFPLIPPSLHSDPKCFFTFSNHTTNYKMKNWLGN